MFNRAERGSGLLVVAVIGLAAVLGFGGLSGDHDQALAAGGAMRGDVPSADPAVRLLHRWDRPYDAHDLAEVESAVPQGGYQPYLEAVAANGRVVQYVIPEVPEYVNRHGSGPTAAGMIIGYYERHGFGKLVPGSASTQTDAVNQMIATGDGPGTHYSDYSLPLDTPANILPDLSELPAGDEHPSDCLADFMKTSWSSEGMAYKETWYTNVAGGFTGYVVWVNSNYSAGYGFSFAGALWPQLTWNVYKSVINSDRPIILLVDSDGDGVADRYVTAVGWREDGGQNYYGFLNPGLDKARAQLWDNGPLITTPGGGCGGDLSLLQTALGLNIFGFGCQLSDGNRVADDFTVTDSCQIDTVTLYFYQTGSTPPTINNVNIQIWSGAPNAGGTVVWGDTTTNRLQSCTASNIYRCLDTDNPPGCTRHIQQCVCTIGTTLTAGTYWIDFQAGGTSTFGPWQPPVTLLGQTGKPGANALQYTTATGWGNLIDSGTAAAPQDVPFILNGSCYALLGWGRFQGMNAGDPYGIFAGGLLTLTPCVDVNPPVVTCPSAASVECRSQIPAAVSTIADFLALPGTAASDDCTARDDLLVEWRGDAHNGAAGCVGAPLIIDRGYRVTDESGKHTDCTQQITVEDQTSPTITTPASDSTVACDGAGNVTELAAWLSSQGGAAASDNCGGTVNWSDNSTASPWVVDCGGAEHKAVTFTATDSCGLTASTTATFTIQDTTPPTIDTPAGPQTVECDGAGNTAAFDAWRNSHGGAAASDTCSGPVTWSDDYVVGNWVVDCGGAKHVLVTFTAKDACDLTAITSATFTIQDTIAPTITTPASPQTVECDGSGNTTDLNDWLDSHGGAVAADICGDVTWSNDFTGLSDLCGATGAATVTFTATDACGLTATTTATFTIQDTQGPVIDPPASNKTVECDGSGNTTELNDWLNSHGGAVAIDACGGVSWSNDFTALSDLCGATGAATVTFTATDACGLAMTTTAEFTIQDTTPPVFTLCPGDKQFDRGDRLCSNAIDDWLNSAAATDVCGGPATITNDAPPSFPPGSSTLVTWTATDACGLTAQCQATASIHVPEAGQVGIKGSLLVYPNVEVRWDAAGNLKQDTFISLTNDYPGPPFPTPLVHIVLYYISEHCYKEYNDFYLTGDEPAEWSALSGMPKGVVPFEEVESRYNDPEGGTDKVVRGMLVLWAATDLNHEISWNHLYGTATIVDYPNAAAWEYSAWAFPARCVAQGQELMDCTLWDNGACVDAQVIPGELALDGFQYDFAPDKLLFSFIASGATAGFSSRLNPVHTMAHDSDLTLALLDQDFRLSAAPPVVTYAEALVWNADEWSFAVRRCISCWDQLLLSRYGGAFLRSNLHTDIGRARVDGKVSTTCTGSVGAAMVGVASRVMTMDVTHRLLTGLELGQAGQQSAMMKATPLICPPEKK